MRVLVLLGILSAGCLAQRPQTCTSPDLLTGSISVSAPKPKLLVYARYIYDALGKRIRLREMVFMDNKTVQADWLLLYRHGIAYKINSKERTCCKKQLRVNFHPLEIPKNATLLAQAVLGASSGPGQGLLVNTWAGEIEAKKGKAKYMSTVTEFGCIPVSSLFYTDKTGWMVTSFFNNVIGIVDPQQLIPPKFCDDAKLERDDGEDLVDFYSLF